MKKDKVLKKWVGKTMKFALLGAVIGLGVSIIGGLNRSFWHFDLNQFKLFLQQAFVYLFLFGCIVANIVLGIYYGKTKRTVQRIVQAEEEVLDFLEDKFEIQFARGQILAAVSICFFILGACLLNTIIETDIYLIIAVLYIFNFFYIDYVVIQLYRLSIKVYPEKSKADPTSMNYLEQWLSYSDEAEKELTYQSAYSTFSKMQIVFIIAMFLAFIGQLLFDTGFFAILIVTALFGTFNIIFQVYYLKLRKQKLN